MNLEDIDKWTESIKEPLDDYKEGAYNIIATNLLDLRKLAEGAEGENEKLRQENEQLRKDKELLMDANNKLLVSYTKPEREAAAVDDPANRSFEYYAEMIGKK